jgi:succinoglycan biosynthesis protein ExoA
MALLVMANLQAPAGEPWVSVIVPCRNEVGHVAAFIESLRVQRPLADGVFADGAGFGGIEILIADGCSDDGTRAVLDGLAVTVSGLRVVDNPGRIVSTGLNAALAQARGRVVVRMDMHTRYAPDYIAQCVAVLKESGATCVGGAWLPEGKGWPQAAIAQAFQSRFGSGGAASRRPDFSAWVDTVYLGCWWRDELQQLGGFDESLVRNQDDELNLRIHRQGGRVWQSERIRSHYSPRASFSALFRQFFQYGYWKVPVIRKHHLPASPRHLVPVVFVVALIGLAGVSIWLPAARWVLSAVLAVYGAAALGCALALVRPGTTSWNAGVLNVLGVAWAFACMHMGYGLGFGWALWETVMLRRPPSDTATRLTR